MIIKKNRKVFKYGLDKNFVINIFICIFISIGILFIGEYSNQSVEGMNRIKSTLAFIIFQYKESIINFLIIFSVISASLIFNKARMVMAILALIILGVYCINFILVKLRGTPFIWADIFMIEEGLGVVRSYNLYKYIIPFIIFIGIYIFLCYWLYKTEKNTRKNKILNLFGGVVFLVNIFFLNSFINIVNNYGGYAIMNWDLPSSYKTNGVILSFLDTKASFNVNKPDNYNEDYINKILDGLNYNPKIDVKPNLVILQLESFIDLARVDNVKLNEDPTPVLRKLFDDYSSGYVNVPTYGGGTVRSEFEMITGISTDYLPTGCIPNNNILKVEPITSLAYTLNSDGYISSFVHNFTGSFFERNSTMPNMGFNNFISKEYMEGAIDSERYFPDDMINLDTMKIILSDSDTPQFIYNTTAGTHGSYNGELESERFISKDGLSKEERSQLEDLAIRSKDLDIYIDELIKFINTLERDTIVVFFSDHLPSMIATNNINNSFQGENKFLTEVIVWDNITDNHEKENLNLELYQLGAYITSRYGLKDSIVTALHNTYNKDKSYQEILETIQYDIIYGDKIYSNGVNRLKPTNMNFGLIDPIILSCEENDDKIYIYGENFNKYSRVIVNEKKVDTEYINKNTLVIKKIPKSGSSISIGQVGIVGNTTKILGVSNRIDFIK